MKEIKLCPICLKPFRGRAHNRRYCSKKCRDMARSEREKREYRKAAEKKITEKKMTLNETIEAAKAAGLSYGQYKAREYMEKNNV